MREYEVRVLDAATQALGVDFPDLSIERGRQGRFVVEYQVVSIEEPGHHEQAVDGAISYVADETRVQLVITRFRADGRDG